jgi:hypothetical protein
MLGHTANVLLLIKNGVCGFTGKIADLKAVIEPYHMFEIQHAYHHILCLAF